MTADSDSAPGAGARFPATRLSVVEALASPDAPVRARAFELVVQSYWKPVYFHLRGRWGRLPEDAEDLTQEFFARALEQEFLGEYDAARARFRTFLRLCLDRFAARERRDAGRLKRGGGSALLPLDFAGAEAAFLAAGQVADAEAEARFQQEWVRAIFEAAVAALARECLGTPREVRFRVFERYDLATVSGGERPSYRELGAALGIPETQVTNHLAWARREFRRQVLERIRELAGSEEEFRAEARALLGVDAP